MMSALGMDQNQGGDNWDLNNKILVMPNMDDLIIPIMHSGMEPQPPMEGPFKDLPADSEKWL
ncbi:homeobox protein EMX2 [Platysternon megacephalum]|uniref:Homeobox protein EMX2 n=1 Tax=Platysternon megacephalum TaxID=55544 RepID=A0A4D9EQR6_9SAUR|nr:homeobox protein EMX2 [Platysternon megacephalum]